ncbi:MAG TPA: sigma-70 family RNA polymerase sigma factor [bacterium]|nr:sigma-70 family RNA polymerase sigma factor [bacterium]
MPRSVPEAVRAFHSGDTEAFGIIYDAFVDSIYRFCRYRVDDPERAEDLTSEVFFKALRSFSSFSGDTEDAVKYWLYRIARTTIIDAYRTDHPSDSIDETFERADDSVDVSGAVADRDLVAQVRTLVDELPEDARTILILRIWEGLSFTEIAEITGKSVDNCKQIASRNLRKIRAEFPGVALLLVLFFL